jgi:hypothetical protein
MSLPPKIGAVLSLVQVAVISIGVLVTGSGLHMYERIWPEELRAPLPAFLVFIRSYGLWFYLVPIAWCVITSARGDVGAGVASISLLNFIAGIVLTVLLAIFFGMSVLGSFLLLNQRGG